MRRSVNEWAQDKGHAPSMGDKPPNFDAWKFAAAKAHAKWVEGAEVTEEEYDAAVHAACTTPLSGY